MCMLNRKPVEMRPATFFRIRSRTSRAPSATCIFKLSNRRPSSHASPEPIEPIPLDKLRETLIERRWSLDHDFLTPQSSHLLNITLADFLPPSCDPKTLDRSNLDLPLPKASQRLSDILLPQGHHLVYFPPLVRNSYLLPDGTDMLHSPGPPFVRRLWAGGSVVFNNAPHAQLQLDNTIAHMREGIVDVSVKGIHGAEKVFVAVQRAISKGELQLANIAKTKEKKENLGIEPLGNTAVVETRNLVFMREKSREEAIKDAARPPKILLPPISADFSVEIIPTPALLFRFSALSFNAHRIHLDQQYSREVEGYRNLLVHGPLSLVLMLSVLRSILAPGQIILRIDYKNLAPLYAEEKMRVCISRVPEMKDKYHVWVEGKEGGYAVKGTATVGTLVSSEE